MAHLPTDWPSALKEINGINLDNYFLHQRDFNYAVYVHKKLQPGRKNIHQEEEQRKTEHDKCKQDKYQQCNIKTHDADKRRKTNKVGINNGSVLEQTIKFAKNLVPIVIPPSKDKSPPYYTIKNSKKYKKKSKNQESSCEPDATYDKAKSKKTETFRKEKVGHRKSFIARESNSRYSGCNTSDDIYMDQSLSCSTSEISERKYRKKQIVRSPEHQNTQKVVVSESFEALATEHVSGDGKIKIHIMNQKDQNLLTNCIRDPLLDAIKNCLTEIRSTDVTNRVIALHEVAINNSKKLDAVLKKLTCIEGKLNYVLRNDETYKNARASTLETLGEDLMELKEASEDESQDITNNEDKVVEVIYDGRKIADMGYGEGGVAYSSVGVKTDRFNKLPTRFCWTDSINTK